MVQDNVFAMIGYFRSDMYQRKQKSMDACRTIAMANVVRPTDGEVFTFGKRLVFKQEDRVTKSYHLFLVP